MTLQKEVETLNVKVSKTLNPQAIQPSRDRWRRPIAAGIENVGEKKERLNTITQALEYELHHTLHPQGLGGTSFCALFYALNF
jgi:hypothetical protein